LTCHRAARRASRRALRSGVPAFEPWFSSSYGCARESCPERTPAPKAGSLLVHRWSRPPVGRTAPPRHGAKHRAPRHPCMRADLPAEHLIFLQGHPCAVAAWPDAPRRRTCAPRSSTSAPEWCCASCVLKPTASSDLPFTESQGFGMCVRAKEGKVLHACLPATRATPGFRSGVSLLPEGTPALNRS
jgi:hypothetical protein